MPWHSEERSEGLHGGRSGRAVSGASEGLARARAGSEDPTGKGRSPGSVVGDVTALRPEGAKGGLSVETVKSAAKGRALGRSRGPSR